MPSTSEPSASETALIKSIICDVFGSAKHASRVFGIDQTNVFIRIREGRLTRRQLRIVANYGERRAEDLLTRTGPRYSQPHRQKAAEDRQRCLDAVAKALALLDSMKTPR
jgi:hypothetical protein